MSNKKNVIVVPDGISQLEGKVVPSCVYRAVLDAVIKHFSDDCIYLAPANDFGMGIKEQFAAKEYLLSKRKDLDIVCFDVETESYIDTRGNAFYLKQYLEAQGVPLADKEFVLVSARLHLRRAIVCFDKEGFTISRSVSVNYSPNKKEKIARRLFYYQYPLLHGFYEFLATIRDKLRT